MVVQVEKDNLDRRRFVRKLLTLGAAAGVAGILASDLPTKQSVTNVYGASGSGMIIDANNIGSSGTVLTTPDGWTGASFQANNQATSASGSAVAGTINSPDGCGLYGLSTATSGAGGAGVYGEAHTPDAANGPGGAAVFGNSMATGAVASGGGVGVRGWTAFPDGVGIIGHGLVTSGNSLGIDGIVNSPDGTGIIGEARSGAGGPYAVSGYGTGVGGYTAFPDGSGVFGYDYATSGYATGIWARVDSPDGTAMGGKNTATSGYANAIFGRIYSPDGTGLYVNAAASGNVASGATAWTSGNGAAIEGDSQAPGGYGVLGYNSATSGYATGVLGQVNAADGQGVYGYNGATSGYATGVYGQVNSPQGVGVVGTDFSPDYGNAGVYGAANVGAGVQGAASNGNGIGVVGQSLGPTVRPIVAWGSSGQTANLQEWWNSSQTALSAVDPNGNFGVGTGSPARSVHLVGSNAVFRMDRNVNSSAFMLVRTDPTFASIWKTYYVGVNASGVDNGSFFIGDVGTNVAGASTIRLLIDNNGNVGIGSIANTQLSFSNVLTLPNNSDNTGRGLANAWSTYSSIRWKTNIQPIQDALALIQRLRGVRFNWKTGGKEDIGLIAEEVGQVVPEIVTYEQNGHDAQSLDYSRVVPLLIEGAKELREENRILRESNDDMSKEIQTLRERLEAVERNVRLSS